MQSNLFREEKFSRVCVQDSCSLRAQDTAVGRWRHDTSPLAGSLNFACACYLPFVTVHTTFAEHQQRNRSGK